MNFKEKPSQSISRLFLSLPRSIFIEKLFRAHWCPPCRKFTPMLAKLYQDLNDEKKKKFEIVFVSSDEDEPSFKEYFQTMPWKALPYAG